VKNNDEIKKPLKDEKRKTEDKLPEAELLYHTLFNQSPDGILIIDTNGNIVEFNEAAHRQLGYSREEFKGLHLSAIDPFQSPEEIRASIKKVIDTGSDEFEVRHKTKEGDIRDVYVITQLMNTPGRPVFHTIWRDVTEHKRADKALVDLNANLQALINAMPDMVVFKDLLGRHLVVNKALEEYTGLPREKLVGRTNDEILPSDLAEYCRKSDEQALRSPKPSRSEEQAAGKDGRKMFLDTIKAPIHDVRGNLMGLVAVSRDITVRKQIEEALRRSETNYRSLLEQASDGIAVVDQQGRYIDVNSRMCDMMGYSREEFLKLAIKDVLAPEDLPAKPLRFSDLLTGEAVLSERLLRRKDGSTFPVEISAKMIPDGRLCGIHRDITGRKQIEEELKESERQYRALFEGSPDAIFTADPDTGLILDVNPAACRLIARQREEIIGLHQSKLHPSRKDKFSRENFQKHINETRSYGVTHLTENTVLRPDGTEVPVEILAQSITIKGKQVLLGVFRDITERKQIEEALRKSEKFIRDILETVDEGFIVIDRDYRILSANKAYLNQVKMPLEQVIGRHCHEISHRIAEPCYQRGEECSVKHAFDTGEPYTALHIHHDKEKNPIYVETKSYPLKDASGNTISAIEIINNATEKKKLEEQLRHSQKMEAVGQLAGGVAHDFNNILTAIMGYGSLMKMKMGDDDPSKNYLQQILDSAQRAANLTQGLLAFSRKQVISPKPAEVNKIIENVEKLLLRLIGEDIELKAVLADDNLTVMADSGQIEQVLVNLATNARDAMPEGGCLTIRTETGVLDHEFIKRHGYGKPGPYALISVTDTGTGMDEKTKERIFEPFFTTKEVGKGTGLGLSIVYGIVKQHNGYITCYSEPGKGATFKIFLPAINREVPGTGTDVLLPASGGTEAVLIAEDDAAVRALVKDVLEQSGYTVIAAVDGEDAIGRFAEHRDRVQLLILDVIMPKKNGKEVYEEIRKDRPDVKVIFSSGYTADILHKKGILERDLNFIPKPVSPTELLRLVRETLDRRDTKTGL
jgi:PAS domain S-box-containing protein